MTNVFLYKKAAKFTRRDLRNR